MFAGVEHNMAGGRASSLTDEEAIALWDAVMATGSGAVDTKYLVGDAYGIEKLVPELSVGCARKGRWCS